MMTVYSVLLFLSPVTHLFVRKDEWNILADRRIWTLHSIVATLYWWPKFDLDGQLSAKCSASNHAKTSISLLRSQGQNFCNDVDAFHHINRDIGSIINKINVHKLFEIEYHKIRTFCHVSLFSEMSFKTIHQTLKWSLKGNTNKNKHITSIYHAAWADWHRLIIQQLDEVCKKTNEDKFSAMRNRAASLSDRKHSHYKQVKKKKISFQQSTQTCPQYYKNHSDRNCFWTRHMDFEVPKRVIVRPF